MRKYIQASWNNFTNHNFYLGTGKSILSKAETLCDIPDLVKKSISRYRNKKKNSEELHIHLAKNKIKLDRPLSNHIHDTTRKVQKKRDFVEAP